jgi:hypothetical protein
MPHEPPAGFVSSAEARRRLGVSDRTLRRRVKAGEIEGEYINRPQGSILYVKLPPDTAEQAAGDAALDGADATEEPDAADTTRQDVALAASLLERLDGVNAALLAATERAVKAEGARDTAQAATVDLRAHLADVQAERDAAAARAQTAEAELQRLRARRWYDPRTW